MVAIILKIRSLEFACIASYKLTVIVTLKSQEDQLKLSADRFLNWCLNDILLFIDALVI